MRIAWGKVTLIASGLVALGCLADRSPFAAAALGILLLAFGLLWAASRQH